MAARRLRFEPPPQGELAPATQRVDEVDRLLAQRDVWAADGSTAAPDQYKRDISLDYVGQEFGVTTNSSMGGYVGGGIALAFSDMLGDHTISSVLQVNGGFEDFGGQVGYLNRKHRWHWGGFVEQIPWVTGGVIGSVENVNGQQVLVEQLIRDRQVDRRVMGVAQYPFSRARRFEVGASLRNLSFNRRDRHSRLCVEQRRAAVRRGGENAAW